jgi:Putative peptidoglycan binding domain
MKKVITILLGCCFGCALGVGAKPEDAKTKAAPKSKPIQQHVNAVPRTMSKTHVQSLDSAKIHQNNISKQSFHKSNNLQSHMTSTNLKSTKSVKQSTIQSNQLPAVQNNPKTAVLANKQAAPNIQAIKAKYSNFKAKPNPAIASAQFNQNYQIAGAQNWSGPQYQAFVSYRPQWHDQGWWRSRYADNLLLIGGGWYYWDAGYWYPAWGYDSAAAYYPYDGPIYVGDNRVPFDQVVADCQATLQEQGYYKGEVDGLMGPLTRDALAAFQRDHGLITTAALDQPTLSSLGLG